MTLAANNRVFLSIRDWVWGGTEVDSNFPHHAVQEEIFRRGQSAEMTAAFLQFRGNLLPERESS